MKVPFVDEVEHFNNVMGKGWQNRTTPTIDLKDAQFVIDFIRVMPNMPKAKVKARVILTPQHAKRVMRALIENVQRYEAQHGTISENQPNNPPFPINFNTPKAEA